MNEPLHARLNNLANRLPPGDDRDELALIARQLYRTDLDRAVRLLEALYQHATIRTVIGERACWLEADLRHLDLGSRIARGKSGTYSGALAKLVDELDLALAQRVADLRRDAAAEVDPAESDYLSRKADRLEEVAR